MMAKAAYNKYESVVVLRTCWRYKLGLMFRFFFEICGERRDVHVRSRRQRQMCIRDRYDANKKLVYPSGMGTTMSGTPCLLYTFPSQRDATLSRMPSSV